MLIITPPPGGVRVLWSVCLCVCMCVCLFTHTSQKITCPNLTKFSIYVTSGCGLVLLGWQCKMLCGFKNNIMYSHNGQSNKTAFGLVTSTKCWHQSVAIPRSCACYGGGGGVKSAISNCIVYFALLYIITASYFIWLQVNSLTVLCYLCKWSKELHHIERIADWTCICISITFYNIHIFFGCLHYAHIVIRGSTELLQMECDVLCVVIVGRVVN